MGTLSDFRLDRRQTLRTSLESLTYINFTSGTPGVVLDISQGGLRFRVLSPMQQEQTVHFWFSADGERVEGDGEVRWIDETRLEGGLSFLLAPSQTRDQIRKWILQTGPPRAAVAKQAVSQHIISCGQATKVTADSSISVAKIASAEPNSQQENTSALKIFSQGLIVGLIISGILAAGALFQMRRRDLGAMLITIGQRLARKPAAPASSASLAPASSSYPESAPFTKIKVPSRPDISLKEVPVVVAGIPTTTPLPMFDIRHGRALISPSSTERRETTPPEPPSSAAGNTKLEVESDLIKGAPTDEGGGTISGPERYFEIRAFPKEFEADKTLDVLKRLGFHVSVIRKGHLWATSYHVLVGPYTNDNDAEAARNDLESHGYQPIAKAEHSRRFVLPPMTLADADTVVQDCIIAWDANSSAATVTFLKAGEVVLKAQGSGIKRNVTYKLDAVISTSADRGPKTLLEIQYHGMNRALVFDRSKPILYFVPPFRPKT